MVTAYKLFRRRRDGSLGPLFINKQQRVPVGQWVPAEDCPTPGYAHRPGWHAVSEPKAPHLTERGRVWARVTLRDVTRHRRPGSQGGEWLLGRAMRIEEVMA
jgi:hypothetical protein